MVQPFAMITPALSATLGRCFRALAYALASGFLALVLPAQESATRALQVEETADSYRVANHGVHLVIAKAAWQLRLFDAHDRPQFAEARASELKIGAQWAALGKVTRVAGTDANTMVHFSIALAGGGQAAAAVKAFGPHGFALTIASEGKDISAIRGATVLDPVEEVYGFGEMWNGHVAQRGQAFDLWDNGGTPDECAYMPYYVSTRNYAFYLNYGGRVHFDVGRRRADEITWEAPTGTIDLTLVSGDSIATTVQAFVREIGLPARPPRWAFEPWMWLMCDPDKPGAAITTLRGEHAVTMVERLHQLDIPVGVTWFEPPWQTQRTNFTPNPAFASDLKGLIKRLGDLGVHTLAWTVPYTTGAAENWQEAVARGYLVRKPGATTADGQVKITQSGELAGNTYTYLDFFNPGARAWWEKQIGAAIDLGFSGMKLDAAQDLQPDALLYGGRVGRDVRNSYAYEYNRVFGEALRRQRGDDFLLIPRASWPGASVYTNFKWPGDLSGTYANNGLPSSIYSTLSLAFCGVPFLSTDIGGFENRPPPEQVWVRWAQLGALLPGMETLHMPWWYSKKASDHYRYLSWLHTDLIPFWNSLAHEAQTNGTPICRPLVWTFQDDLDSWRVDDEFTVGDAFLVAPIINPERDRDVYLPPGRWYSFWNEQQIFEGPAKIHWSENTDYRFPLFVREGAIVPLEVVNDVTGFGSAESKGAVTLALWPPREGASTFVLHDREEPVRIEVARPAPERITAAWSATSRDQILRVIIAGKTNPVEVAAGAGQGRGAGLPQAESLEAFRAGHADGWYYESGKQVLWIRRAHTGAADSVAIRLGAGR